MKNTLELLDVTIDPKNNKNGGFVQLSTIYKQSPPSEDCKPIILDLIEKDKLMVKTEKDGEVLSKAESLVAFCMNQSGELWLKMACSAEVARVLDKINRGGWSGTDLLKSTRPEGIKSNNWSRAYISYLISRGMLLEFTKEEYSFLPKSGFYITREADHARHVLLIGNMMQKPVKGYAALAKRTSLPNLYVRLWMAKSKEIIDALPVVK